MFLNLRLGCVCAMVGMGDVRIKMERGLKMSFRLEVVFLYLSYLSILFVFEFLFIQRDDHSLDHT